MSEQTVRSVVFNHLRTRIGGDPGLLEDVADDIAFDLKKYGFVAEGKK